MDRIDAAPAEPTADAREVPGRPSNRLRFGCSTCGLSVLPVPLREPVRQGADRHPRTERPPVREPIDHSVARVADLSGANRDDNQRVGSLQPHVDHPPDPRPHERPDERHPRRREREPEVPGVEVEVALGVGVEVTVWVAVAVAVGVSVGASAVSVGVAV